MVTTVALISIADAEGGWQGDRNPVWTVEESGGGRTDEGVPLISEASVLHNEETMKEI